MSQLKKTKAPQLDPIITLSLIRRTLQNCGIQEEEHYFDDFWKNPNHSLRAIIKDILSANHSPARFVADMIDYESPRNHSTQISEWMMYHFGNEYHHEVRKALEKHSIVAQRHFSHYLLKRLLSVYEHFEQIIQNEEYLGAQYRLGHKLVIKQRSGFDGEREEHFKRVVDFASLDEAVALAEIYQSHPKVQGAALFCAADWAYQSDNNISRQIATALNRETVAEFVKACADADMNPTNLLYCFAEISKHHRDPEALDSAVAAARAYRLIPGQDPKTSLPEIILTYLADLFITCDKDDGTLDIGRTHMSSRYFSASDSQATKDSIASFYEAGFERLVQAFRLPVIVRRTRGLQSIEKRHDWIVIVKACALSYTDFPTALGACADVFDAYEETSLFDIANEIVGRAVQIDHNYYGTETQWDRSFLIATRDYLTSNEARSFCEADSFLVKKIFNDNGTRMLENLINKCKSGYHG